MPTVGRRVVRRVIKKRELPPGPSRDLVDRIERDKDRLHHWMEGNIDTLRKWDGEERKISALEHRFDELEDEASAPITLDESRILKHDIGLLEDQISRLEHQKAFKELSGEPAPGARNAPARTAPPARAPSRPPSRPLDQAHKVADDALDRIGSVLDQMEQTMQVWATASAITPQNMLRSKRRSGLGVPHDRYGLVLRFLMGLVKKGTLGPARALSRERVLRTLPGIYAGVARYLKVDPEEVRLSPLEEEELVNEVLQSTGAPSPRS